MKKNIQEQLISIIRESLKELGLEKALPSPLYLDLPTDSRFGDLTTNAALQLSKAIKRPPQEIAAGLI